MSKKKLIAVAIILALILLIGGLLAYFTDTDTETNQFTLGDPVDIEITEVWTPQDGQDIHPGAVVTKEPSIQNQNDSAPAYVFAEVTIPCYQSDPNGANPTFDTEMFTHTPNSGWTLINTPTIDQTTGTKKYVYAYGTSSAMTTLATGATTSTPVFSSVTLAPTMTEDQGNSALTTDIVIDAVGIQTDNLGTTSPSAIYGLATT